MDSPSGDQLEQIIRAAILAPSADNRHPIRFDPTPGRLRLWADHALLGCDEEHRTVLALIGIGAVVENILLEAPGHGFQGIFRFVDDWQSRGLIAEIDWKAVAAAQDPLAQAIPRRHTNRRFFDRTRLAQHELDLLTSEFRGTDAAQLQWLDARQRRAGLRLVLLAESARFGTQLLHRELFSAIRFDVGWTASCDEGLPPGSLEVEPFLRTAFAALRHWKLARSLNAVGAHNLLALRAAYLPCLLAAQVGVISTRGNLHVGAVMAGRAFERLWLRATDLNLALQPLAAAAILPLQRSAVGGLSEKTLSKLKSGWETLTSGATPLMLFRLGRAKPPTVTTSRKDVRLYLGAPGGTEDAASQRRTFASRIE